MLAQILSENQKMCYSSRRSRNANLRAAKAPTRGAPMGETEKIVFNDSAFAIARQAGRFGDVSFPRAAVRGDLHKPRHRGAPTLAILRPASCSAPQNRRGGDPTGLARSHARYRHDGATFRRP